MNKNHLNISKIETYLHSIIDNVVSNNTYVGTLPDTIQSSWSDMCLIDCDSGVRDFDAYGQGVVLVWLYAKPLLSGAKNVATLSSMEMKLDDVLRNAKSDIYQINRRSTYSEYDSERKWHCNIIELNILIV